MMAHGRRQDHASEDTVEGDTAKEDYNDRNETQQQENKKTLYGQKKNTMEEHMGDTKKHCNGRVSETDLRTYSKTGEIDRDHEQSDETKHSQHSSREAQR